MNIILYASDHAAPCKSAITYFKWMHNEMEEYYQQGDIEKKLGYTITQFYDRTTCNPFIYQRGYLNVIVEPLYITILDFLPECRNDCMVNGLEKNKQLLDQKVLETKDIMRESLSTHEINALD